MSILICKKIFFLICIIGFCSFNFLRHWNSPVKGSVNPSNAAIRAWVFSKTDTFNAPVNISGLFEIDGVKAGSYTLMVEAHGPYRNTIKDGIVVVDGQLTDVGVIEMQR